MGNTIWVEVRGRPLSETADDSNVLYKSIDQLDALAARLKVAKPSTFLDYTQLEQAFAEFMPTTSKDEGATEPSPEATQAKGQWFDSQLGLATFQAIQKYVEAHAAEFEFPADRFKKNWHKKLSGELASALDVLEEAAARGQQFRLTIVA